MATLIFTAGPIGPDTWVQAVDGAASSYGTVALGASLHQFAVAISATQPASTENNYLIISRGGDPSWGTDLDATEKLWVRSLTGENVRIRGYRTVR